MKNNEIEIAIKHFYKNDKVIYSLSKKYGPISLKLHRNYFRSLVSSIVSQQLSIKAAATIFNRFLKLNDGIVKPERVITLSTNELRSAGLSFAKCRYVKDLSQKLLDKSVNLSGISKKNDDEVIEILTKVKGIGVWSAHMFLIFTLGRLNILPVGDLGLIRAAQSNYNFPDLTDKNILETIANKNNWSPFSSIASLYLWKSLDNK